MVRQGKGKAKTDDTAFNTSPLRAIQKSILRHMHRSAEPSYRFICNINLKDAWEGYALESIIPSKGWTDEEYRKLTKDYLKIISILIVIDWQGFTTHSFRRQFFRGEGRKDKNLPFTIKELEFLETATSLFFEWQSAFTPAVIEYHEGKHVQEIDSAVRLPFVEQGERMGIGSYGEVLKVSIAREFYQDRSQKTVVTNSSEIKVVAVKVYHSDNSKNDFHEEVRRLDYLKEGYQNSRRVMKHIAAIVHGNSFMIVLPLAELRDLEVFLRGGRQTDGDTKSEREVYNFDDKFKALKDNTTLHREMIRECFELSSALLWLHEELRLYNKLDRYLAHMDLKPDNILIDSENDRPAGKWMISDFGVSLFDKATNEPASDVLTARDIGRRATSRANQTVIHRNHVGFSPPEIGLPNCDGRKCDVWSFVCIMCDVLAFSLGRSLGLHDFRSKRFDEDDNFFAFKSSRVDRKKTINESNTEVKWKIRDWLRHIETENSNSYPWVSEFINVIRQGLVPDPNTRPGIRSVMEGLDRTNTNFPNGTITSLPVPLTSSEAAGPQQLELPVVGHSQAHHEANDPARIVSEGSSRHDSEHSQIQHSEVIQQMSLPSIGEAPQFKSRRSSGEPVKDHASLPTSNGNTTHKADPVNRPTQHHHSNSLDTQGSRVTVGQPVVRSGDNSRKYSSLGAWTLPLKPKATLSAVALDKLGRHVAMLFERRDDNEPRQRYAVHVYPLHDDRAGSHKVDLSPRVHWAQIWTANRYFAVGGQSAGRQFHGLFKIEIHDLQETSYLRYLHTSHPRYQGRPCSQIALSDSGIAAGIYGPHVIVLDLQLQTSEYVEFSIDDGYSIKKAEFSAVSNVLCLWAIKGAESTTVAAVDVIYFYKVSASRSEFISKGIYSKAEVASIDVKLLPFPHINACVIQEQKGATFIAHPSLTHGIKGQARDYIGIPYALAACVTFDDMLICIEKNKYLSGRPRQIREYPFRQWSMSEGRYIGPASEELGTVDRDVDENAQIAVHLTEDHKQMLILCSSKGVVHRFLQAD